MPKLGESITEGTIISWSVKVGDTINEDDVLFEVNTAKVSAEIPSPVAGKILEILFNEGDTVAVGTVVAVVQLEDEEGESEDAAPAAEKKEEPATPAKAEEKAAPAAAPAEPTVSAPATKNSGDRWYSPVVLGKARDAKIDKDELDAIPGSGYEGRLSKRDIEKYIDNKKKGISASDTKPKSAAAEKPAAATASHSQTNDTPKPAVPVAVADGDTVIAMDPIRKIDPTGLGQGLA